jgi:hypothetical protein
MPKPGDDKYFGGARGAAQKAWEAMVKAYGRKDAEHVYQARIAKQKRRGRKR